jgi:hypothetical protein
MKKEKMICVEWDDACFNSGYYDKNDNKKFEPVFTKTIGFLVKSDRQKILVAMDKFYDLDKTIDERHISTIPKKIIKRIIYLTGEKSEVQQRG